ncbi:hypothetical protein BLJAPNOD_02959 [Ensifer sp. M14]|uniref:hypothetical protein n=1 Tax=Ensifer sp. M14 TaxID=2203782 RepID=UPI000DE4CD51|nr:hypothetical protein [Ensifer sp. M14]RDL51817.1 hypothetical protein BLJAPNOD_02959 [Ensifer sp. M14]
MQVLNLKPAANSGGGAMKLIAQFDLVLSDDVRVYGLKLMQTPSGQHIVSAPNGNGGRRLATFSPTLATAITQAAICEIKGHDTADGTTSKN